MRYLGRHPEARPVYSTIVIGHERQTRNIFYTIPDVLGAGIDWPDAAVIQAARVLLIDDFSVDGMLRAASIARAYGVAVVADFETGRAPRFGELLSLADHLILSYSFAVKLTGETQPPAIAATLWTEARQAVVITCGAEGAWYLSGPGRDSARHQPAFKVDTVDTKGCGDVFHGAYAAGLVQGLEVSERVRFAAAAAALKATQPGGQAGIPTLAAVTEFLKNH